MATHISIRLAWHNDGWNGHICQKPKENTYCIGRYSYPGDMIKGARNLAWENEVAGQPCSGLDEAPPCAYSINAFGRQNMSAYADPPEWFRDESERANIDIPPATVCVWPYEEMYTDDVKRSSAESQKYNYDLRLEKAKKYFSVLKEDRSLIFYYANLSNP